MTRPEHTNPYRTPKTDLEDGKPVKDKLNSNSQPLKDIQSGDKLVVLSTYDNSIDAHMFRNELEQHGITARVGNETTTAIFGATIAGPSSAFWIEVLVLESQSDKALEIKNKWLESNESKVVVEIPEWQCKCGETVDAGFAACWNCESDYVAPEEM